MIWTSLKAPNFFFNCPHVAALWSATSWELCLTAIPDKTLTQHQSCVVLNLHLPSVFSPKRWLVVRNSWSSPSQRSVKTTWVRILVPQEPAKWQSCALGWFLVLGQSDGLLVGMVRSLWSQERKESVLRFDLNMIK